MRRTLTALLLSLAAAGCGASTGATPGTGPHPNGDLATRVDALFARWDSTTTPGCAVGVSRAGEAVLARAYGMADLEHDISNTPATIFEAGSVSKQVTAAAIVLLALDGRLSLDDDVRAHVPELPDYGTPITLRHLLTHTSGLRDWGSVAEIAGWGRSVRTHTHEHVLDLLSRQSALNFVPGAQYSYSNSGYNLLAIIVDRTSGMPFAEFSRRRIFEPLGMTHTQWRDDYTRIVKGRSAAYALRDGEVVIDRPIENVHGNGGLLTTIGDLLTWNEALAAGRLGGARLVEAMHRQGVLNDGERIAYASGLSIGEHRGVREVSHTGATSGYRAFLARYPEQQLGVALLCNVGAVNPGRLGHAVADVFLDAAGVAAAPRVADAARAPDADSAAPFIPARHALGDLAGEYYSTDAETTLIVALHGDTLVLERRPATRIGLRPSAPDTFESQIGRIVFHRNAAGQVTHFSLSQPRVHNLQFDRTRTDAP